MSWVTSCLLEYTPMSRARRDRRRTGSIRPTAWMPSPTTPQPTATWGLPPYDLGESRIQQVPQAVADEVETEYGHHDAEAGKDPHVRGDEDESLRLAEHQPPLGCGGLRPDAQEAQRRHRKDAVPNAQRRLHQCGRQDPREDMAGGDAGIRRARRPRGIHGLTEAHRLRDAPDQPRVVGNGDDPDRD